MLPGRLPHSYQIQEPSEQHSRRSSPTGSSDVQRDTSGIWPVSLFPPTEPSYNDSANRVSHPSAAPITSNCLTGQQDLRPGGSFPRTFKLRWRVQQLHMLYHIPWIISTDHDRRPQGIPAQHRETSEIGLTQACAWVPRRVGAGMVRLAKKEEAKKDSLYGGETCFFILVWRNRWQVCRKRIWMLWCVLRCRLRVFHISCDDEVKVEYEEY